MGIAAGIARHPASAPGVKVQAVQAWLNHQPVEDDRSNDEGSLLLQRHADSIAERVAEMNAVADAASEVA